MFDMDHPLLDTFLAIREQLDVALSGVEECRGGIDDRELAELVLLHKELGARVEALGLNLVTEAVATDLPHRTGATSPAAWLGGLAKMSPHLAKDKVRTALALDSVCPDTKDALEAGRIAYEHASAIASIVTDLPKGATAEQVAQAEHYLLDRAPSTNGLALRKLTKRVDDLIDPEGLLARERTAQKKCDLKSRDNHDGTHTVTWTTTDERHAKWKAAVGPLAAPRPATDGTKDERTPGQRLDDAMNDLVDRVLRFGDLPTTRGFRPAPHRHHQRGEPAQRKGLRDHHQRRDPHRRRSPAHRLRRRDLPAAHRRQRSPAQTRPLPAPGQHGAMARPDRP